MCARETGENPLLHNFGNVQNVDVAFLHAHHERIYAQTFVCIVGAVYVYFDNKRIRGKIEEERERISRAHSYLRQFPYGWCKY